jgi:hypothetical protein
LAPLSGSFAGVALLFTLIGLDGVIAYLENLLVPDLVTAFMTAPLPPNCAPYVLVRVWNSRMASTPSDVPVIGPRPRLQQSLQTLIIHQESHPLGPASGNGNGGISTFAHV